MKSRILFEQMLGRATRLCPEIGKTHFEIYDAVGVYESLEPVSEMKPVVANPNDTFESLLEKLKVADNASQIQKQINQLLGKLQRTKNKLSGENLEQIQSLIGEVKNLSPHDAKKFLLRHVDLFRLLQQSILNSGRPFVISDHEDELTEHKRGYGNGQKPQDYLDEFAVFLKANLNEIAALNIVCTRPKDLTRADLKSLRINLDVAGFTLPKLNTAVSQMTNAEMTADIISLIRRYTLGAPLVNHNEKIKIAVDKLKAAHNFTAQELNWINRIERCNRQTQADDR